MNNEFFEMNEELFEENSRTWRMEIHRRAAREKDVELYEQRIAELEWKINNLKGEQTR